MILIKKNKSFCTTNNALSEIVGTILILAIVISIVSVLYIFVFSVPSSRPPIPTPSVNIIGLVEKETDNIILEHHGGNSLKLEDLDILFTLSGADEYHMTIINSFHTDSNEDNIWNIGEQIQFNVSDFNPNKNVIQDQRVEARITDKESKSVILRGIIQDGAVKEFANVAIRCPSKRINGDSATIGTVFGFGDYTMPKGESNWVTITIWDESKTEPIPNPDNDIDWINASELDGEYNISCNLEPDTEYYARAWIRYTYDNGSIENDNETISSNKCSFSTSSMVLGAWRLDHDLDDLHANDSSINQNHGNLEPLPFVLGRIKYNNRPDWVAGEGEAILPTDDPKALKFDGIDDYVKIPGSSEWQLQNELTIATWIKPLQDHNKIGIFGDNPLDDSFFDYENIGCKKPKILWVSFDGIYNIYAIVFYNRNNDGWLITVKIDNNGIIQTDHTETRIIHDYLKFDENCTSPDFICIQRAEDQNIFAIAYTGYQDYGNITTVRIEDDGDIDKNFLFNDLHKYSFYNQQCWDIRIIKVVESSDIYAIVFGGSEDNGKGFITTVNIQNNGVVTSNYEGCFQFYDGYCHYPDIISISNNNYALVFGNSDQDGKILTMTISLDGLLIEFVTGNSNYLFDSGLCIDPDIVHGAGDYYIIAYTGKFGSSSSKGLILIIEINTNGNINPVIVDYFIFESTSACYDSNIFTIKYSSGIGIFGVAYLGPDQHGYLKTLIIRDMDTVPDINDDIQDSIIFNSIGGWEPDIVEVSTNGNEKIYAIAHRGYATFGTEIDNGGLVTIKIDTSQGNTGDIFDKCIDYEYISLFFCLENKIFHISSNIYGIAYVDLYHRGFLYTIEIDDDTGIIGENFIDGLIFDYNQSTSNLDIISITSNIFAFVYEGSNENLTITTVQISNDGATTYISSREFNDYKCIKPKIIKVEACSSSNIYAIIFDSSYAKGRKLVTINIESDGTIGSTFFYEFNLFHNIGIGSSDFSIFYLEGNRYAISSIANRLYEDYLKICIVDIDPIDYSIDYITFSANAFNYIANPSIFHLQDNKYALIFTNEEAFDIYTFSITEIEHNVYNISFIDKQVQVTSPDSEDISMTVSSKLTHLKDDIYIITSQAEDDLTWVHSLRFKENGEIVDLTYLDDFINISDTNFYDVIPISEYRLIFAVISRDKNLSGTLRTFKITEQIPLRNVISNSKTGINIDSDNIYGFINDRVVSYSRSEEHFNENDWNYIVLTYDNSPTVDENIKLYVNTEKVAGIDYEQDIEDSDDNYYFGLNATIEEEPHIYGTLNFIMDKTSIYSISHGSLWVQGKYEEMNMIPIPI